MRFLKMMPIVPVAGLTILVAGCNGTGADSVKTNLDSVAGSGCTPTCDAGPECLSLVDNAAASAPGFRMTRLTMTKPVAFSAGIIKSTIDGAVLPDMGSCNVRGTGSFNWLLQFDTTAGTVKTGGAKPVADPTQGYTFVDGMEGALQVSPVVTSLALGADGTFSMSAPFDKFIVPIYMDATGTDAIYIPLSNATFTDGTISSDQNCIGKYNADNLSPANGCETDGVTPTFLSGASVHGFINLEEADAIQVTLAQQSLCVLLSGDATKYGDHGQPSRCSRTGGVINFQGDACSQMGQNCTDSVTLDADFAASAVKIN